MPELVGNSIKSTITPGNEGKVEGNTPEKHLDKVTVGDVIQIKPEDKKPGFFVATITEVGSYLWNDVLKPGLKNLIFDLIVNGSSNMLFDDAGNPPPQIDRRFNRIHYNYNGMYIDESRLVSPNERRNRIGTTIATSQPSSIAMGDYIWFEFEASARKVISDANDIIDQYKWITVMELYELAGLSCDWTLQDYGWSSFAVPDPKPYKLPIPDGRRGWIIRLPKAHKK